MSVREKRRSTRCETLTSAAVIALSLVGVSGQTAQADTVSVESSARQSSVVSNGEKQSKEDSVSDEMDSSTTQNNADNAANSETDNDDSLDADNKQVADEDESATPVLSDKSVTDVSDKQRELKDDNPVDGHSNSLASSKDTSDASDMAIAGSVRPNSALASKAPVRATQVNTETIDQWMPNKRLQQAVLRNLNESVSGRHWQNVADISKEDMLLLTKFSNDNTYIDGETEYSLKGLEYAKNLTRITLSSSMNTDIHGDTYYQGDVRDISPLANLIKLTSLDIQYNKISDISVLSNLINLTEFNASMNYIGDFRPVTNLPKLISESNGNQYVKLAPIYVDRQKLTGHIAGNYYSSDGKKIILAPCTGVGEPVWMDANGEAYYRWYPLAYHPKGEDSVPQVTKDGDGGLNFTNVQKQESGNKLPSMIGPTHVIHQKDEYFLVGQYRVGTYIYLSIVQPYILADKAAAITVHYQDEAGKALADDQVLDNGYIGEAYTTSSLKIKGYTFKKVKDHNATGQYTATPQTVVYIYAAVDDSHSDGNHNNGGDNHTGEPSPVTPPVVPVGPTPQTPKPAQPSTPMPAEPTQVISSAPGTLDEATAVAGSAGATIQGITVKVPEYHPQLPAKRVVSIKGRFGVKSEVKLTPATLPQTNEQNSQLKVWGIIGLALGSLGAAIFGRQRL
ncbi:MULTISPECIES: MucBP domain-containing protein [Lactobacillaceae]|uniref:MucBP domain-containing protein n=1 Tax=Lactobacillaceae TaxID=33958 RepID=UPI001456A180|nr:MucBP domain-containing protein [Lactobacillus sp. HBUAS51381]NLR08610.1 hypothetical protein [Lactobacillus sp. HBUAS51381]